MPKYAMAFAEWRESDALKTISYYSMIVGLRKFISPHCRKMVLIRPMFHAGLATLTAAVIYLYPSPLILYAGSS